MSKHNEEPVYAGNLTTLNLPTDSNVISVRQKMATRARLGLNKYGVTTERTDLTRLQWLQHAQDEAMDLAVYLEKLIQLERAASSTG